MNKYLEKIAKFDDIAMKAWDAASRFGKTTGKYVGTAAWKGTKAFGNQVHLAAGGAFRDYAYKNLNVKSPYELGKFTIAGGKKDVGTLKRMAIKANNAKTFGQKKIIINNMNNVVPGLQKQQRNARMIVGGTAAATGLGVKAVNDKLKEPKVETYSYY